MQDGSECKRVEYLSFWSAITLERGCMGAPADDSARGGWWWREVAIAADDIGSLTELVCTLRWVDLNK